MLIQAFAKFALDDNEIQLVVAGPDQERYRDRLEDIAEAMGISHRITWTDMISGDLKWGALRASEVFVLPSHQENFGIAIAEALACSIPVLTSTKVNIWREIKAYEAGLVEQDDLAGILRLCGRWLQLPAAERQMMGHRARWCFEERFDLTQVVRKLIALWWADGVSGAEHE